jgi:hypothetical protein
MPYSDSVSGWDFKVQPVHTSFVVDFVKLLDNMKGCLSIPYFVVQSCCSRYSDERHYEVWFIVIQWVYLYRMKYYFIAKYVNSIPSVTAGGPLISTDFVLFVAIM